MSERVTRITSYGIVQCADQLLLCRLSARTANPGVWTLPGGGLEFGEHPDETLRREILEETGLTVKEAKFLDFTSDTDTFQGREFQNIRFFYRVERFEGELKFESEGTTDECRWISQHEIGLIQVVPMVQLCLKWLF